MSLDKETVLRLATASAGSPELCGKDVFCYSFTSDDLIRFASLIEAELAKGAEPFVFGVFEEDGRITYSTGSWMEAQDHINEAVDFEIEGAGKWRAVPLYTHPQPPTDHAKVVRQLDKLLRPTKSMVAGDNWRTQALEVLAEIEADKPVPEGKP